MPRRRAAHATITTLDPLLVQTSYSESDRQLAASHPSVHPVVVARGWLILAFAHINLEFLAVALISPIGDFVAHAEKERAAPQIKPADQHPAQVAYVRHAIAAAS